MFDRNSELINSDLGRSQKAQKLITKIVNALTRQSEIGAPMTSMYLLKHPDHYTSHEFQWFYWHSYLKEAKKA
ncbi:hypothetical protein B0H21DRAFT_692988 [Amylocystis lapponica]|nr:hypothetical protein B0H21DRAFT_692988 [Amylocystis lapponica]